MLLKNVEKFSLKTKEVVAFPIACAKLTSVSNDAAIV
jgi:hypothetical protein